MYSTLPTALLSTGLGIGFCVSNFLSILSDFLSQQKLTHKNSCPIFHKIDKKTKTPIYPNCHQPNGIFLYNCKFYNSRIEVLQNLSAFCVRFSCERKFERMGENLKHKIPTQLIDCSHQRQSGPCPFCAFCHYRKQRYVNLGSLLLFISNISQRSRLNFISLPLQVWF